MLGRLRGSVRQLAVIAVATIGCRLASAAPVKKSPPHEQQFRISDIQAHLYYHERGEFDRSDIASGRLSLRNIGIGEGDALTPSGAMLLVVTVTGPDFAKSLPRSAVLTVTSEWLGHKDTGTTVLLGNFFSQYNRIQAPVLVYGIPCSDATIRARLDGVGTSSEQSKVIPFSCGE
jgi:hypothetical protein